MSDSIIKKHVAVTRSQKVELSNDSQFVSDLFCAYQREPMNEHKAVLVARILLLMLKGVKYERLEMKRKVARVENK